MNLRRKFSNSDTNKISEGGNEELLIYAIVLIHAFFINVIFASFLGTILLAYIFSYPKSKMRIIANVVGSGALLFYLIRYLIPMLFTK